MPTVHIPALLRRFTAGRDWVEATGRNVREVIEDLERQFPELHGHLMEKGELNPAIAVSVDGEISAGGLLEPVGAQSELHFMPPIAGG